MKKIYKVLIVLAVLLTATTAYALGTFVIRDVKGEQLMNEWLNTNQQQVFKFTDEKTGANCYIVKSDVAATNGRAVSSSISCVK